MPMLARIPKKTTPFTPWPGLLALTRAGDGTACLSMRGTFRF
ncbi:hypothetical protein [Pseudomonas citronellolis]|nr:hypothetical protein [Pseudomonas citronellolis]MCP1606594.1 hypothetical protein [Pseudomonas citronellolis]MCP1654294.1 hypothetical protein [Pseudomonas citronellolis]MCP1725056.1 hypothetical protein [Pseudomonas citronellolis]